ncbi:MAG: GAF domain-containing protein [Spirochaetales bacterium]|nr:GAF domain-containing protein [Spirochaetales bacterium]
MGGKKDANTLLRIIENLHAVKDLDLLLERVLHESRSFVHADGGTLYTIRDNRLFFAYIENETLQSHGRAQDKFIYMNMSIPLDKSSIAGFCAVSGQSVLIDDVYALPPSSAFRFNAEFDTKVGYKTHSILAVPLKNTEAKVVGVLQLINALDAHGTPVPFSQQDRLFISYFAQHAAMALEKAEYSKEMVLRMVDLARLRDPHEDTLHATRVGEYSLELFDSYAQLKGFPLAERTRKKEAFRLAAMLHDIGKVAMSAELLSKPEEYNSSEKEIMFWHTIYGARLFAGKDSFWDRIAFEVVLNHHERWDGGGYPGHVENIFAAEITFGPGKKGKEIPLSGRIVAIADVFDALVSTRSYKEPWSFDAAFRYVRNKRDKQFDPELVDLFIMLEPKIRAIFENIQ